MKLIIHDQYLFHSGINNIPVYHRTMRLKWNIYLRLQLLGLLPIQC